ncbi:MAG TPA: twin-arginine translocation signal domain-containing protein [Candidatus Acidoferrum sp.]|jgi:hypothetical protein|nr:twin-arginine translocation signal domain-containing protein [Candidatus Acidoferrum sp.]
MKTMPTRRDFLKKSAAATLTAPLVLSLEEYALAAGAIPPRAGFQHAFANGADFVAAGMFDFQIAEDASILPGSVQAAQNRERDWFA